MSSAEVEMATVTANFQKYLRRRGLEIASAPSQKDIIQALQSKENVVTVVSKAPAKPLELVDGVRTPELPIVGIFYPPISYKKNLVDAGKFEQTLNKITKQYPKHELIILGKPDRLRDVLLLRLSAFIKEKNVGAVYRPYYMFIAELPEHDHARCVRHQILTKEEADREKMFYFKYARQFAPIPVTDPLCVWAGVRAGDLVKITGGASGAATHNIRFATNSLRPVVAKTSL
jgi:DNA-directed RNA polymerase subunit H (RpoH/RPB5)